jgi:hypothetical protein
MLEYYRFKVIHNMFLKGQVEAACLQLRELQKRYLELCEENAVLKSNIREYEDILFLARNFCFDGTFYWLMTGSIRQGPFCAQCYNHNGQIVRITEAHPFRCPNCGAVFEPQALAPKVRATGNNVRALEQSTGVSSLRAIAAMDNLAQIVQEELETSRHKKNTSGTAVLLTFNRPPMKA